MALKDTWKETGKELGHGFRDLGKALIKTAAYAADKADEWANGEETQPQGTDATVGEDSVVSEDGESSNHAPLKPAP